MSSHADTIRLREVSEALLEAWRTTDPEVGPPDVYYEFRDTVQPEAVLALLAEHEWVGELNKALNEQNDRLLAENQRLRLVYLSQNGRLLAENQRLREVLQDIRVGHCLNGSVHWPDPESAPNPNCPLCAAAVEE